MSIATEIERIQNAKASIKASIEAKGVTVGDGTIDTYASKIDEIQAGGGGEPVAIPYAPRMIKFINYKGTELNYELANLDLANLTTLESMFSGCSNLTTLDLSKFDTKNITSMSGMFSSCSSLQSLNINHFNTTQVKDMSNMFNNCSKLKTLDLSGFYIPEVTSMSSMFSGCTALTNLNISNFNLENTSTAYSMFQNCSSLTSIELNYIGNFPLYSANAMFSGCSKLTDLDVGEISVDSCANIGSMFSKCSALTNLKLFKNIGKGYTTKSNNSSSCKLDLSACTNLTHESLVDVINKLYDLNLTYDVANGGTLYTQQLVLGSTNLAKLTAEEIAIATNKGWTVS